MVVVLLERSAPLSELGSLLADRQEALRLAGVEPTEPAAGEGGA